MSDGNSKRGKIDVSGIRIIGITNNRGSGITWPDRNNKPVLRPDEEELSARIRAALVANSVDKAVALGEGLPESFFDYNLVPEENRSEALALTKSLKGALGRHLTAIVEIGEGMMRQRTLVGPANFQAWLEAELHLTDRTARSYMALARFFQGRAENFSGDLTTARQLIAGPDELKIEIRARMDSEEIINKAEVTSRLAAHKARGGAKAARDTLAPIVVPQNSERIAGCDEATPASLLEAPPRVRAQVERVVECSRGLEQVLSNCSDLGGLAAALIRLEALQLRACSKALSRLLAALPPG